MKTIEIFIAPLIGSILAIIFAKPKSLMDAVGRLGIGVFVGIYFAPMVSAYLKVDNPEIQSGLAAALGLFGFFMVEAITRILKNINNIKDIK